MRNVFPVEAHFSPPPPTLPTNRRDKPKGRFFWFTFGMCRPKVTMFAVEMWFGAGDGVECGRSTGLCPLPLGVPRCVIHNKKMLERNFGNFEKNNMNHQNHSNNAKKQKNLLKDKTSTSELMSTRKEPSICSGSFVPA